MVDTIRTRKLAGALAAFTFMAVPTAGLMLVSSPVLAQSAAAKAAVDVAKAKGIVGEQGDGLLGFVSGTADAATTAAVEEINAGRRKVFASTAAKSGVTPDAAGEATAQALFQKIPSGQYFKPLGGSWTKK
jgi:hypothetical protein